MLRIISVHINEPRFIKYQKILLDKFIIDDFEFIVFDDSQNKYNNLAKNINSQSQDITGDIISVCNDLKIKRIPVPITVHDTPSTVHINRGHRIDDPAGWCANSIQFAVNYCRDNFKSESDIILNIDSDMFPVRKIDIVKFIEGYQLAGVPQVRSNGEIEINYLWNGIFCFLPFYVEWGLFNWDLIHGNPSCDVGGEMHKYLTKNLKYKKIFHLSSMGWNPDTEGVSDFVNLDNKMIEFINNDPRNVDGNSFSEIYQPGFLHYRAGGNWDMYGGHDRRKELLFTSMDKLIKD
jgi:hypothetical protein